MDDLLEKELETEKEACCSAAWCLHCKTHLDLALPAVPRPPPCSCERQLVNSNKQCRTTTTTTTTHNILLQNQQKKNSELNVQKYCPWFVTLFYPLKTWKCQKLTSTKSSSHPIFSFTKKKRNEWFILTLAPLFAEPFIHQPYDNFQQKPFSYGVIPRRVEVPHS